MAGNEHVRVVDARRNALLFRAGYEVIKQDPEAPLRTRPKRVDRPAKVIGTMERFDHDPHLAQFIAPDMLDELGVMDALNPDPMRQRDSGASDAIGEHATGSRDLLRRSRGCLRAHQGDGATFEQEPTLLPPEVTQVLTPVAQGDTLS